MVEFLPSKWQLHSEEAISCFYESRHLWPYFIKYYIILVLDLISTYNEFLKLNNLLTSSKHGLILL
jgi:hypothetical protein